MKDHELSDLQNRIDSMKSELSTKEAALMSSSLSDKEAVKKLQQQLTTTQSEAQEKFRKLGEQYNLLVEKTKQLQIDLKSTQSARDALQLDKEQLKAALSQTNKVLSETQTELELDKAYVLCAVSSGASRSRVLFVHILPNIIRPLVHFLCLSCAEMIMNISAFSFIGLTLGDDVIDWGSMLSEGRSMLMTHPSLLFLPILFIFLCTLAFNLLAKQLEGGEQA